jgi:hypothetical protein
MARRRHRTSTKPAFTPESGIPSGKYPSTIVSRSETELILTYEEYIDFCINCQPHPERSGCYQTSRDNGRPQWHGTDNFEHAARLEREGWPEGCQKMANIVAKLDLKQSGDIMVPQPIMDVSGDYVDVATFIQGVPECMVRWEEVETQKRIAKILFNGSVSGGVSVDAIQWKGATVLALIDRLEATGIRVELDIINISVSHRDERDSTLYTVKKAQDSLHIDRLAFHLVNPSSLRRFNFACCENKEPWICERMDYQHGYGSPGNPSPRQRKGYDLIVPELHLCTVDQSIKEIERMFNTVCKVGELVSDEWNS